MLRYFLQPAAASGDAHKLQVRLRGGENLVARDANGEFFLYWRT